FSEKRVLLLHNFEKIKKSEKRVEILEKIIKHKNSWVTLIILSNTSAKEISEEIAYLKKYKDCVFYNLDIHEKNLPEWIIYKANKVGISLKPDAIYYLIELTGGQPGVISSEIEKISLLSEKTTFDLFDIKDMLSEFGEFTAFDLVEAIRKKDKRKAFRILEELKNTEPDMILGALNWYYSNREKNEKVFPLLYKTNLALRQGRSCSLELLLYELLKD
ncbi:MAG: DNA polymerase III subunit delta, partial [Thermodesulfovibrionaceae bacterium]